MAISHYLHCWNLISSNGQRATHNIQEATLTVMNNLQGISMWWTGERWDIVWSLITRQSHLCSLVWNTCTWSIKCKVSINNFEVSLWNLQHVHTIMGSYILWWVCTIERWTGWWGQSHRAKAGWQRWQRKEALAGLFSESLWVWSLCQSLAS